MAEIRLVTPELTKALANYPLYSQDGKGVDAICVAKFFIGNIRWYVMEGEIAGKDFDFFGITCGMGDTEYGYMSAREMSEVKVNTCGLTFHIERDANFTPCKLKDIKDPELQSFLSEIYS